MKANIFVLRYVMLIHWCLHGAYTWSHLAWERRKKSQVKLGCNINCRKGNQSGSVNERETKHMRAWELVSQGWKSARWVAQTCSEWWHHSRFQTDWEWSRCYDCVTARSRRGGVESNTHSAEHTPLWRAQHSRTRQQLHRQHITSLRFESCGCFEDRLVCLWFQVAGEHKYHPECFVCLSCKVVIEDRDTYALVERSKLYW